MRRPRAPSPGCPASQLPDPRSQPRGWRSLALAHGADLARVHRPRPHRPQTQPPRTARHEDCCAAPRRTQARSRSPEALRAGRRRRNCRDDCCGRHVGFGVPGRDAGPARSHDRGRRARVDLRILHRLQDLRWTDAARSHPRSDVRGLQQRLPHSACDAAVLARPVGGPDGNLIQQVNRAAHSPCLGHRVDWPGGTRGELRSPPRRRQLDMRPAPAAVLVGRSWCGKTVIVIDAVIVDTERMRPLRWAVRSVGLSIGVHPPIGSFIQL